MLNALTQTKSYYGFADLSLQIGQDIETLITKCIPSAHTLPYGQRFSCGQRLVFVLAHWFIEYYCGS